MLAQHVLGRDRAWMLAHGDDALDEGFAEQMQTLTQRRALREPLQYIVGEQEFYGLRFAVTPAVLIPRPETELLVEAVELWAAETADARELQIVDVGTGSGAIAIALATHVAAVKITAVDISVAALEVATSNALAHTCGDRVRFVQNDLLAGFAAESFHCVVSNPPYVPAIDAPTMQREVVEHEPHSALFAGDDGLEIYRRLIPQAHQVLRRGGLLAMEFGYGQSEALAELLQGWHDVRFINDLAGIPRHVLATKP
ncbi:peptide chain release factor N(5)-glutamine methyltransferase [Granulicella cerasi]|uniref:Release factor glutamine methyltransferase n=1 Tax=Granulicella cerasi TaxID=741063 RepID=A0ABW1Z8T4_9BACT